MNLNENYLDEYQNKMINLKSLMSEFEDYKVRNR